MLESPNIAALAVILAVGVLAWLFSIARKDVSGDYRYQTVRGENRFNTRS